MNHRIPFSLYKAMEMRGFSVCRFNFRGVGESQGVYDKGEGELSDAAAVLEWMQSVNPNAPYVWVAGFAFGSWIGMQMLMRRPEIKGFVSVSLPANEIDFSFLAPCPQSGLVLHGARDNIIPEDAVHKVVERLNTQKGIAIDYRVIENANHFYNDQVDLMIDHVHDYMNQRQVGLTVPLQKLVPLVSEEKKARKKAA